MCVDPLRDTQFDICTSYEGLAVAFGFPRSFQEVIRSLFQDQGQGPPSELWLSSYPAVFSKWLLRNCDSSQDVATRPEKTKGRSCGKEKNGTVTEPQDWPTQRVSERHFDGRNKTQELKSGRFDEVTRGAAIGRRKELLPQMYLANCRSLGRYDLGLRPTK